MIGGRRSTGYKPCAPDNACARHPSVLSERCQITTKTNQDTRPRTTNSPLSHLSSLHSNLRLLLGGTREGVSTIPPALNQSRVHQPSRVMSCSIKETRPDQSRVNVHEVAGVIGQRLVHRGTTSENRLANI